MGDYIQFEGLTDLFRFRSVLLIPTGRNLYRS